MINQFLTIDELELNTMRLRQTGRAQIEVRQVGESWNERKIEMVSVGNGDRDALVVGVPHANEPVGAVTVERMLAFVLGPQGHAACRRFRWHFIKAIDPEGLRLNGGWLKSELTLTSYYANFFRPALDRQPDTTFPVEVAGYRFDRCTPENKAWQVGLELTRPQLHASLHNCDYGGCFHLISNTLPGLTATLDQIILRRGLTYWNQLDQVGFPLRWISTGVAIGPSACDIVATDIAAGLAPGTSWPSGDTSASYARRRYGTFSITSEVPLWDSDGLRDGSPSGYKVGDQLAEQRSQLQELAHFLYHHMDVLEGMSRVREGEELLAAIREMAGWAQKSFEYFADRSDSDDAPRELSTSAYLQRAVPYTLFVARGFAMAGRMVQMARERGRSPTAVAAARIAFEAREHLAHLIDPLQHRFALRPVPLAVLTGIQMDAVLAAAEVLAGPEKFDG